MTSARQGKINISGIPAWQRVLIILAVTLVALATIGACSDHHSAPQSDPHPNSDMVSPWVGMPSQDALDQMTFPQVAALIKPCGAEDGTPAPCYWDAGGMGNGTGVSFYTTPDGAFHYRPDYDAVPSH